MSEGKIEEDLVMLKRLKAVLDKIFGSNKKPVISLEEKYPGITLGDKIQPLSADASFDDVLKSAQKDFDRAAEIRKEIKQEHPNLPPPSQKP